MRQFNLITAVSVVFLALIQTASASSHYTAKQLDALAERVGSEFWINAVAGRVPVFLTAPAAGSPTIRPANNESFEITELVGQANKNPYYKVKFASGKIAYLRPEVFHEEINSTILIADPLADEKSKAEKLAEDEKQRAAWINAQGWPPAVKEAALKKQPMAGLTGDEVKHVLGAPRRVVKVGGFTKARGPANIHDERWFYPDGSVLYFTNGILSKVDRPSVK